MTETLRETTVWKSSTIRNGIYLMSGGKCLAFCNYKGETTYLTKPMQIDKRGRQFEKMVKSPFKV